MNIGEVSRVSGIPIKTIRYYEDIGLIYPHRQENGYRVFSDANLHKLKFVRNSRNLGFSVKECAELLDLQKDPGRTSAQVKNIAQNRLSEIEQTISNLNSVRAKLKQMIGSCQGSSNPECAILEVLGQSNSTIFTPA